MWQTKKSTELQYPWSTVLQGHTSFSKDIHPFPRTYINQEEYSCASLSMLCSTPRTYVLCWKTYVCWKITWYYHVDHFKGCMSFKKQSFLILWRSLWQLQGRTFFSKNILHSTRTYPWQLQQLSIKMYNCTIVLEIEFAPVNHKLVLLVEYLLIFCKISIFLCFYCSSQQQHDEHCWALEAVLKDEASKSKRVSLISYLPWSDRASTGSTASCAC